MILSLLAIALSIGLASLAGFCIYKHKDRLSRSSEDSPNKCKAVSVQSSSQDSCLSAEVLDVIARHDKTRNEEAYVSTVAGALKHTPLSGVGALLNIGMSLCEADASNNEEIAKAKLRLESLALGLQSLQHSLLANPEDEPRMAPAIQEVERSCMRLVELIEEASAVSAAMLKFRARTFKDRFDAALTDVERARNDLMLHVNLEVLRRST